MPFPPLPYTPQLLTSLERTVTPERLIRYLVATNQDLAQAIYLYEANVALSEVLYGLLHGLEVSMRNAIHQALSASYGRPDWYEVITLSQHWQAEVVSAKRKVQQITPGPPPPGKVLAELSFGFWVGRPDFPPTSQHPLGRQENAKSFPQYNATKERCSPSL